MFFFSLVCFNKSCQEALFFLLLPTTNQTLFQFKPLSSQELLEPASEPARPILSWPLALPQCPCWPGPALAGQEVTCWWSPSQTLCPPSHLCRCQLRPVVELCSKTCWSSDWSNNECQLDVLIHPTGVWHYIETWDIWALLIHMAAFFFFFFVQQR